jgi:hypothetical protein
MRRVIYKELPSNRRFGVELELSNNLSKSEIGDALKQFENLYGKDKPVKVTPGPQGWDETNNNDYWHVKFDRTCGPLGKGHDYGWEVASYIGKGPDDIDHIARAARFLFNSGAQTNFNCGLHVHVETKDFNCLAMGRLIARWLKVEKHLLQICHKSRIGNEYCQSMRHRMLKKKISYNPNNTDSFWYQIQPTDYSKHNNYDKRYALNPMGFAIARYMDTSDYDRNTIELRLPECLLEESHVRNWVRFILLLVEDSLDVSKVPQDIEPSKSVNDVLYYMGLAEKEDFSILDPELSSLRMWFLKKLACSEIIQTARQANKRLEFISQI